MLYVNSSKKNDKSDYHYIYILFVLTVADDVRGSEFLIVR